MRYEPSIAPTEYSLESISVALVPVATSSKSPAAQFLTKDKIQISSKGISADVSHLKGATLSQQYQLWLYLHSAILAQSPSFALPN